MKVSDLIAKLEEMKNKKGDVEVFVGNEYGHTVRLTDYNVHCGLTYLYLDDDDYTNFEIDKDDTIVYLGG